MSFQPRLGVSSMAKLTDLGFKKGVICECIVSSYNPDDSADAAPMGVTMQDPQHIVLEIFTASQTLRNLQANKCGVVNVTSDIEVFYKTTFKEANPDGALPQDWFERAQMVKAPELCFADATVAFSVLQMEPDGEKTRVICLVEQICARENYPQVYCRAMSLTLEAIIHATRVKAYINNEKEQKRVGALLGLIQNCSEVVNRVAPNSAYSAVMDDLNKRIDSWRLKP